MSLTDPRVTKQAEVLIDQSIKFREGEKIIISSDFDSKPLVYELYKLLVKRGAAEVRTKFSSIELDEIYYKNAKTGQISTFPEIEFEEIKKVDCYIRIISGENSRGLSSIDPGTISSRIKVIKPIIDYRVEKTRWVITRFPSNSQAQEADMSLSEYEDFVFSAINNTDWASLRADQEKIVGLVNTADKVEIMGKNTKLQFSIRGRKAINACGEHNMPDGEVFTSVVENSVNGYIKYSFPAIYLGKEFHEIELTFKDGKAIKIDANKNKDDLIKILNTDDGSKYLGEFGIGNNFSIDKFTKDILFDEKIGGTIHLALGKGYKETLSKNESAIHWDMILDLRKEGEIRFDGKVVQKDGKWLFD